MIISHESQTQNNRRPWLPNTFTLPQCPSKSPTQQAEIALMFFYIRSVWYSSVAKVWPRFASCLASVPTESQIWPSHFHFLF